MALQCKDSESRQETPPLQPPYLGGTTAGHSVDGEGKSSSPPRLRPSDRQADDEKEGNGKKPSDLQTSTSTRRILKPRGQGAEEKNDKKMRKPEFHVTLTKEEIEEDFILMTGFKPPRRPKHKHKTSVQNHLNSLFPGLHFPKTITGDRYEGSDQRR